MLEIAGGIILGLAGFFILLILIQSKTFWIIIGFLAAITALIIGVALNSPSNSSQTSVTSSVTPAVIQSTSTDSGIVYQPATGPQTLFIYFAYVAMIVGLIALLVWYYNSSKIRNSGNVVSDRSKSDTL